MTKKNWKSLSEYMQEAEKGDFGEKGGIDNVKDLFHALKEGKFHSRQEAAEAFEKEHIDGSGVFTDSRGQHNIHTQTLYRPWKHHKAKGFLTLFALFWNAFVAVFVWGFTRGGPVKVNGVRQENWQAALDAEPTMIIFLLFPMVGLGLLWFILSLWLNKTKYSLEGNHLSVKSGPLPWFSSSHKIEKMNIEQAHVEIYTAYSQNNRPVYSFRVVVSQRNGPPVYLKGISTYRDARILEQWIENNLGIRDKAMAGEAKGA